jgi:multidrug transporter EmrE-like cation transporter
MHQKTKGGKMNVLFLILICVGMGVIGQLSMKKGMNTIGNIVVKDVLSTRIFEILLQKYVFIGMIFYVLASFLWLVILSQEELSFVYPLISIGYIITAILSKLFFNESLTLFRLLGILLIFGGVYLIVLKI